jgi:hypothetical protein
MHNAVQELYKEYRLRTRCNVTGQATFLTSYKSPGSRGVFIFRIPLAADANPAAYRKETGAVQYFRFFAVSILKGLTTNAGTHEAAQNGALGYQFMGHLRSAVHGLPADHLSSFPPGRYRC